MFKTILMMLASVLLLAGCASDHAHSASGKPHAECLVCKHENDLACVDIEVDAKTPRTTIDGKEYFFCSEQCKKECMKTPQKYIPPAK